MHRFAYCLVTAALAGAGQAAAATLTLSCTALGAEADLCREAADRWSAETGNTVEIVHPPQSASEQLALYQQLLAAESPDIDVLQIDVIWPGILGPHLLDLSGRVDPDILSAHAPALLAGVQRGDAVLALPWFVDAGVLYYRADLLDQHVYDVPSTWQELTETAAAIQEAERAAGNDRFWGFVWQGRAYEGLTCNALEWIASFGGGTVVDADGSISLANDAAAAALDLAASWVGTISPPGVLNYTEEDARAVFQSGDALFMRNWPYAFALAQGPDSPIAEGVAVAVLPAGGPDGNPAAALGGGLIAVSRYSRHPDEAVALATFLTSPEEQRRRAIAGSYAPTYPDLYGDAELVAAVPFLGLFGDTLASVVARPAAVTGGYYNEVSSIFYGAVHAVLSGAQSGQAALADARAELIRLGRGGSW